MRRRKMQRMRLPLLLAALVSLLGIAPLQARDVATAWPVPAHGVIGVEEQHLTPGFWIERLDDADQLVLDASAIAMQNARMLRIDPTIRDLRALPTTLSRAQVVAWISALSRRPRHPMFDVDGQPVPAATLDTLVDDLALAEIPERLPARHGLVVQRADLRTFPTTSRIFSTRGETDIDRFQESALFPGTPVVIAHESRDRRWWFVLSPRYAAWIEKRHVAEGSVEQVLGYGEKNPYRVITGATERTVFTREQPALSQLPLDMGVRVPVLGDWPAGQPVNGQHPHASHVIELPLRNGNGTLRFAPALLRKQADSAADYLPLTRANLIRQSFKFLGERYGWGHAYDGRDCSGFVSEVYQSLGVQLPRNTGDQAMSPALDHRAFTAADAHRARMAAVRALQVGDLVYIPGHVMMVIGEIAGEPYVIHDTAGIRYRKGDGALVRVELNGVSVSPLTPLLSDDGRSYVDRITSIVSMRR